MKFYFLSAQPCALFLNGVYFGMTDAFERFADVAPKDNVFVQFIPQKGAPVKFFITESLRFQAPDGCEVYLLDDGAAVYAYDFPPEDAALCVHLQARIDGRLLTVFTQGRTQLSIEGDGKLFVATMPPAFLPTRCEKAGDFFLLSNEKEFALTDGEGKILLFEKASFFQIEQDILHAVLPLSDRLRRSAECRWSLSLPKPVLTKCLLKQENLPTVQGGGAGSCPDDLIAYAFFQSLLIGGETEEFLDGELLLKKGSLTEFLGEFTAVTLTNDPFAVGLVYPKGKGVFEVKRTSVVVEKGKITDIRQ